ncbi:hypothetical protein KGV52_00145 [Candidatus Gracilibacteria bacterium]|nr:hypothetical protein [Candidatus Gracilibacteria bacterium]
MKTFQANTLESPISFVDLLKDQNFILKELKKSESESSISLEESYKKNMEYLDKLYKKYETV